jgi:hypothetical protein
MKRSLVYAFIAGLILILGASFAWSQDDPFAGLGGSGDSAVAAPDGSSSIRAKRKVSKETFEGIVVAINKGKAEFPMLESLQVKITKQPGSKAEPHRSLDKGAVIDFTIQYAMTTDGKVTMLNMASEENQTNIGAYYFQKGDKVQGEVIEKTDKGYVLKWIERK